MLANKTKSEQLCVRAYAWLLMVLALDMHDALNILHTVRRATGNMFVCVQFERGKANEERRNFV